MPDDARLCQLRLHTILAESRSRSGSNSPSPRSRKSIISGATKSSTAKLLLAVPAPVQSEAHSHQLFADKYHLDFGVGAEGKFDAYRQLRDEIQLVNKGRESVRWLSGLTSHVRKLTKSSSRSRSTLPCRQRRTLCLPPRMGSFARYLHLFYY